MDAVERLKAKKEIRNMMHGWGDEIQEFKQDLDNLFSNDKAKECFIEQVCLVNDALGKMSACLYEQDRYFKENYSVKKLLTNDEIDALLAAVPVDDESNNQS